MKRIAIGIVAALALIPAAAMGLTKTKFYSGTVKDGGNISLRARINNGKLVNLPGSKSHNSIKWGKVPIACDQGNALDSGGLQYPVPVNRKRRFSTTATASGPAGVAIVRITGRFTKNKKAVHGTIRVHGNLSEQLTGCEMGTKNWTVRRP